MPFTATPQTPLSDTAAANSTAITTTATGLAMADATSTAPAAVLERPPAGLSDAANTATTESLSASSCRDISDGESVESAVSSTRSVEADAPPSTHTTAATSRPANPTNVPTALPTHYLRKSSLDRDAVEGYMVMHVKKQTRKTTSKLFTIARPPTFYVVADARKSVLEVFSNDTKRELVYLLSLTHAVLSFESDDANMMMEKCFCVEAKTWKKRNTVAFKHQGFVFFEANQVRMLLWVKCIHLAIKNATTAAAIAAVPAADYDLFRTSNASSADCLQRLSNNDEHDSEQQHETLAAERTDASGAAAALRKQLVIDPTAPAAPTASPREVRTPVFNRLNAMFGTNRLAASKSPRSPSAAGDFADTSKPSYKEPKAVAAVASALLSTGASTSSKSAFHYNKTATARTGNSNNSNNANASRLYALHSPFASVSESNLTSRKRDDRMSGSSSSAAGHTLTDDSYDDVRSSRLREYAVPPKISRRRNTVMTGHDDNSSDAANAAAGSQTLDHKVAFVLVRCVALWIALVGGAIEASIFLPLAAAGVFAHVSQLRSDEFAWTALAMATVFFASRLQGVASGVAAIVGSLYLWSYAEFKTERRRRRVRVADRLLDDERDNMAHLDIPNWICHPDVDRVEWLNRVFVTGWPYIKLAIRNSLLGSLNPLLDSVRPAFMSSLSLVRVDLGDRTPHISGVKFVSANPLTDEVTLDVEVRVVTDESLVAELRLVSNLGAAAVVSLRDLFLVGTLRITLNPLCVDWPCFSALSLSFTNRPVFDFSLTAAKINISNVPFASEWLHTFLHDLLNDYFVWPRVVHIPLWDENALPVAAAMPAAGASAGAAAAASVHKN